MPALSSARSEKSEPPTAQGKVPQRLRTRKNEKIHNRGLLSAAFRHIMELYAARSGREGKLVLCHFKEQAANRAFSHRLCFFLNILVEGLRNYV